MPSKSSPRRGTDSWFVRGIPAQLKARYKRLCDHHHISMTEGLARFMTLVTQKDNELWKDLLRQPPTPREFSNPPGE